MNDKRFERALRGSEVMGTDWSLSLGYTIHVLTDNVDAAAGFRKDASMIRSFISETSGPDHAGSSGYSLRFDASRKYVIIIMSSEGEMKVSEGRMIELVAHECSHIVDYIAEMTCAKPCTETRAYTLDWLVGKVTHAVLPHLWDLKKLGSP